MNKKIELRGIRQNNLKNIDVDIDIGSFTVICGPSGSGKSSLAFETLYAEGQRRYIDSLSNYTKQFLNKAPKPLVDSVNNIPPAIALEQKNQVRNSRSTVGSLTEINDYLRLLFARLGEVLCPNQHGPVKSDSPSSATERILKNHSNSRGYILFKIDHQKRSLETKELLKNLIQDGFLRWCSSLGKDLKIEDLSPTSKLPKTDFYIVVDRLAIKQGDEGRIQDSLRTAMSVSVKYNLIPGGRCLFITTEGSIEFFSEDLACSVCDFSLGSLNPNLFNSNSPVGACANCNGFGNILQLDLDKIIPNQKIGISKGAVFPFTMPSLAKEKAKLYKFCKEQKIDTKLPWEKLDTKIKSLLLNGSKSYYGIEGAFEKLEEKRYKMHVRILLARFKSPLQCKVCQGSRLNAEVLNVYVGGKNLKELQELPFDQLLDFFKNIKLSKQQKEPAKEILEQLLSRLNYLCKVGLPYLSLIRETRTLSGGEFQRIKLSNQLGMQLSQTLYVLDEPTIGLHPRDNLRLIQTLKDLNELGNTLVIVEHDREIIENASHIIEIGPQSGKFGGELLFSGNYKSFQDSKNSVTLKYLHKEKFKPTKKILAKNSRRLELTNCSGHNLKNVNLSLPLNQLILITGVSGSGKSSLIQSTLYPALMRELQLDFLPCLPFSSIKGASYLKEVVMIDQKAVGRSGRSNPASYLGVFDEIRKLFSLSPLAKERDLKAGYFSLNVDGGRCASCNGDGFLLIDMQFMDDVILDCEDCAGARFKKEALEIRFQENNIQQVLEMTVDEACEFFRPYMKIQRALSYLQEVGLGYIQLGQPANSLSGGESQRLKIAKELSKSSKEACLYILDEPTSGLHFGEVEILSEVLKKLVSSGATVIVVEHNMELIQKADYIVDIGPDGGERGGEILYQGDLPGLLKVKTSETAKFL